MIPYFIVRGLPGVGKTTIVNAASDIPIIDPDHTNISKKQQSESTVSANIKYRKNLKNAKNLLLSGNSFIWTQPWSKKWGINLTIENLGLLANSSQFKPVIITIIAPIEVCYCRYVRREGDTALSMDLYTSKYVNNFDQLKEDEHSIIINNNNMHETISNFTKIIARFTK